jgi:hypothetical protein
LVRVKHSSLVTSKLEWPDFLKFRRYVGRLRRILRRDVN